ncbi:MAG: hypothetical protein Greene041619_560 [Candidatus Peregrinibacteria bacterium Greene0416_19]|nr:MAG: hypothetical protein Greene041619_560 [Candidatus Peregrinibacteria bacterium Greene0416_19]
MTALLTPRLEQAIAIAALAHEGQLDKARKPYILHPLRVMLKMPYEDLMIVAVLHDVIEDTREKETPITGAELLKKGFSKVIVDAIEGLTNQNGENYEEFIERAKSNWRSRKVKIADLQDNMDLSRIRHPTAEDMERIEKYKKALSVLQAEEEKEGNSERIFDPALIEYEGKTWFIDLSNVDNWQIKIVEADGSRRPALKTDGDFMEVLNMGWIIERNPIFP